MEVDEDVACIGLVGYEGELDVDALMADIGGQLPEGIELLSASLVEGRAVPTAEYATYLFPLDADQLQGDLGARVWQLLARESIEFDRRVDVEGRTRKVDVRPFLKSAQVRAEGLVVECRTGPEGSIRVEEICRLLGLEEAKLAGPVRRTNVEWKCN